MHTSSFVNNFFARRCNLSYRSMQRSPYSRQHQRCRSFFYSSFSSFRRPLSTLPEPPSAPHAHSALSPSVQTWAGNMKSVHNLETDRIDESRVRQLLLTLPTRQAPSSPFSSRLEPAGAGEVLPAGFKLILFPPLMPESDLNADGTDPTYNSISPFTRRMWAGGGFDFSPSHQLRVGEEVSCETTVESVQHKVAPSGGDDMVFVNQQRLVRNSAGEVAITEKRTHVFLRPPTKGVHLTRAEVMKPESTLQKDYSLTVTPTPVTLFRFSALTFNSHFIHLDPEFARNIDGHPDRLVHGPLTALMLLDLASGHLPAGRTIASFAYRARYPVIVNRPLTLAGLWSKTDSGTDEGKAWATNEKGRICMTAQLQLRPS